MKSFSTVRDTQRGTQSYMEKRRGRREIEVTWRRRGGIKRGESKLASNHFPMCSPQSGSLRNVHGVTQKREEGGKRQKWPGGEIKRGESKQPVINSLCALHSLYPSERFVELHREEKREEGDRGCQEDKGGNQKERHRSSQ